MTGETWSTPDPHLLDRLLCEAALMAHHVRYGVPQAPPSPPRVCRNGHWVNGWDDHPDAGCLICVRVGRNKRDRLRAQHVLEVAS